ncbi:LapA family protein [Vibrio mangrovi]|uniref:Probable lipopolysaccharide assembly protein A n=1 Tax=Vibrio mangrovi TaxID=474394 RepID=A0A1Y6IPG6_9VIBR|nr:lipopolysaccharide assembly protein LapA domain-containing protein [Vibrio mangrovi]MDW6003661.1 lipopolysaccharide assembly protein LapA domain-containing protein [Vibrio mangrovi]SMR99547.1 Inner membrane protein YciS [Vibrio mangrovi]
MRVLKILFLFVLFLIALALGAQNQEVVTFNYLLAKGEFHLSWLLGVVFVAGFAIAWLIFGSLHLRAKLQIRRLNKQLKKNEPQEKVVKEKLNIG